MTTQHPTPERIMQMAWGYTAPLLMEAALRVGLFDVLDAGPTALPGLAEATQCSQRGTRALADALIGLQLLARDAEGRYTLTPESAAFLVSTKPSFQGGMILHTSTQLLPNWMRLTESVRTGRPSIAVNQEQDGSLFFEQFVASLFPLSYPASQTLAASLEEAAAQEPPRVLDIAAGSGVWGIGIAQRYPQATVTALDWPGVLPVAQRMAAQFGVGDRFRYLAGELHQTEYGTGYTVATLGHILHSEGELRSRALLCRVYEALASGGIIVISEFLVDDDRNGPPMGLIFAANMLTATEQGDTFSFEQIRLWLQEAGFIDARLLPVPGPSPLILANKPRI